MKENIQKKYLELQNLVQQIKETQQQISILEKQSIELNSLIHNLEEIQKTEIGKKILLPLGAGIFIDGELKNNKTVVMNVGADITVKKEVSSTIELIKKQIKELEKSTEALGNGLGTLALKGQTLQQEIEKLAEKEGDKK